jgi:hypothetical protein
MVPAIFLYMPQPFPYEISALNEMDGVLKACYLVLFSLRKMQKKTKQDTFENILPHISTTGAL